MNRLATTLMLAFLVPVPVVWGQWRAATAEELLRAMAVSKEQLGLDGDISMRYELLHYADGTHAEASERHRMRLWRKGVAYRAEQLGILTLQDARIRVVVDTAAAVVVLATPTPLGSDQVDTWGTMILPVATRIEKRSEAGGTRYQVALPEATGYAWVQLLFDGAQCVVELSVQYARSHLAQHAFSPSMLRPKVVTRFERPQALKPGEIVNVDPTSVVDLSAKTPKLRAAWSSYQLIDTRYR